MVALKYLWIILIPLSYQYWHLLTVFFIHFETFLVVSSMSDLIETWTFWYYIVRLWILFKSPVYTGFLCYYSSNGRYGGGGGGDTASLFPGECRSPSSLPSLYWYTKGLLLPALGGSRNSVSLRGLHWHCTEVASLLLRSGGSPGPPARPPLTSPWRRRWGASLKLNESRV